MKLIHFKVDLKARALQKLVMYTSNMMYTFIIFCLELLLSLLILQLDSKNVLNFNDASVYIENLKSRIQKRYIQFGWK